MFLQLFCSLFKNFGWLHHLNYLSWAEDCISWFSYQSISAFEPSLVSISCDWPLNGSARTTGSSVWRRRKRASTITMTNRFSASFECSHDSQVLALMLFTFAGTWCWENGVEEAQRVKIRHWYNFVDIVNIWICQSYGYWHYWKSLKYWHSKEGVHSKMSLIR